MAGKNVRGGNGVGKLAAFATAWLDALQLSPASLLYVALWQDVCKPDRRFCFFLLFLLLFTA